MEPNQTAFWQCVWLLPSLDIAPNSLGSGPVNVLKATEKYSGEKIDEFCWLSHNMFANRILPNMANFWKEVGMEPVNLFKLSSKKAEIDKGMQS